MREAGVRLLDPRELGDLLEVRFDLVLDQLDLLGVRSDAIALHHGNIALIKVCTARRMGAVFVRMEC